MKLRVIPLSIRKMNFPFLMYPIGLRVWGVEKSVSPFKEMTGLNFGGSNRRVIGVGSGRSTT
jgi:hypothetical protein